MSTTKITQAYLLVLREMNMYRSVLLSECHVRVSWITQGWPCIDPLSYHLLWLGYASYSAQLPTRLLTHSTCQKQDRCPWYPNSSPNPQHPTSWQHLSASPCCSGQTPWPPSIFLATRLAVSLSVWGDICNVTTAGYIYLNVPQTGGVYRLCACKHVHKRKLSKCEMQQIKLGQIQTYTHERMTSHVCIHRHTYTDEAVAHPLTGRWPDSPAAASCLMFHSEDHISLPDSSANKRKTEKQWQREALLALFFPHAAKAPLPDTTPSAASQHVHGNHSVSPLLPNVWKVKPRTQVDIRAYLCLSTSHYSPAVWLWLRG